ncbi:branched-chain amino acid ABC transporter permease [Frigoriglobus tundricola]|uniref:Branched-chain amino acid ABC transporter, permease protein LivM n=1 Tax=Frigoriglobus tundricola TaxID=2774151 RepID=A0A6M5YGY0_9BACT|nr:branched-chain amino acid ABC transporter permease [Frigoriglobus tundricola]QJW93309.1 Branched-chain amino acid ABC transporter, permease protein LivM [Frigoriglobus tundricola]
MSAGRVWVPALFAALAVYPFLPIAEANRGEQFTILFVYAILALGLNVVLGYTGLLHLGIAAFFGIGAYTVGVLTVPFFPFQQSFLVAAAVATTVSAAVGIATTAPILRLRGDYFALVTLGFGLITLYAIRNLDAITEGTKGLNPIEAGPLPGVPENVDLSGLRVNGEWGTRWYKYPYLYFLVLGTLGAVMLLLRNVERSRLGRAWVALREDELAASCMGLNPARLKLAAVALGAGLAGLAGAFYALALRTTGNPQAYDFTLSMIMVCCVILGGLGNRSGVLIGVLLLMGFDRIATNLLDNFIQERFDFGGKAYLKVSGWKLIIFGVVLIVMMRFRPEGLLPEARHQRELHPEADEGEDRVPEPGDTGQKAGS